MSSLAIRTFSGYLYHIRDLATNVVGHLPYTKCTLRKTLSHFHSDASRTPEREKRRLSSHAPRALFGTGHAINEGEPPRSRRRLCPSTSESAKISSAPASSAFSGTLGAAVAAALKPTVSEAADAEGDDAESVECLGDVGIDEQLARRQKEQGVVDLTGDFNAVE